MKFSDKIKIPSVFIIIAIYGLISSCSENNTFNPDCDLCSKVNKNEIHTLLNNFIYNDIRSDKIGVKAESELKKVRDIFHSGFKIMECGCRDNAIIYRIWCSNDDTFELTVVIMEKDLYKLEELKSASFLHP